MLEAELIPCLFLLYHPKLEGRYTLLNLRHVFNLGHRFIVHINDHIYFMPLFHLRLHFLRADLAKFVQGVRWEADATSVTHQELHLKVTRIFWILLYLIRIDVALAECIYGLAPFKKTCVEGEAAN